jgi:FMN-dependent NADH-azoreductase
MSQILLVTSSPRGAVSYSSKVARSLADGLAAVHPPARIVVRDLAAQPLSHIGTDFVEGLASPAGQRTAAQNAAIALSDEIIAEVFAADVVVIASAMINFGLSSTLKAWFDYLLRAGATFRYSDKGVEGLVTGKKAYIVAARGGIYSEGGMKAADFQEPYVRQLLAFIGITDIETLAIEGVALGLEVAQEALASALTKVSALTAAHAMKRPSRAYEQPPGEETPAVVAPRSVRAPPVDELSAIDEPVAIGIDFAEADLHLLD